VTPIERVLHERIRAEGSITVEAYMETCNRHYYATRDPLGTQGDFTTAPEISQMFGELVGAALGDCWTRAGAPQAAIYVELGPGRGTLAADAVRAMRSTGFAGEVHLVETSPVLRKAQERSVPDARWHDWIADLPPKPMLLVANEFLDALPIRQHIEGAERKIVIAEGGLAFDCDGEIVESSPAREEAVRRISAHIVAHGGAALLIDYGHERSEAGDTLQAVRGHRFAPVLERPGEQDLTAHVDFEAVRRVATETGGLATRVVGQGEWLRALGIDARAKALSSANPGRAADIEGARDRLISPDQMGELFKAMAIHAPGWPIPAGLA